MVEKSRLGSRFDKQEPTATPSEARSEEAAGAAEMQLADLLRAIASGCASSFTKLYRVTRARLYGVILRILRDGGDSEDALQEAYVKAWRQAREFDGQRGNAMNWLMTIARNCALDRLRRLAARPVASVSMGAEGMDPYDGLPADAEHPAIALSHKRAALQVRAGLAKLAAHQRQCVSLALFDGLSHSEIAEQLQRPLGTVKSCIRRAITALQPLVSEYGRNSAGA